MRDIFIVGTEHQLRQLRLAIAQRGLSRASIIIIVEVSSYSGNVLQRVKDDFPDIASVAFESWTFLQVYKEKHHINVFLQWCDNIVKWPDQVTLYSSHYDSDFTLILWAILKPQAFILLDEGTASFSVCHMRRSCLRTSGRLLVKSMYYGRWLLYPKSVIYFTRFDLKVSRSDTSIRYTERRITNRPLVYQKNRSAVVGTSLVDINMLREEEYFIILRYIRTQEPGALLYYPHRKEAKERLDQVRSLGFIITDIGEPFEEYFSRQSEFQEKIVSLNTTFVIGDLLAMFVNVPAMVIYEVPNKRLRWGRAACLDVARELRKCPGVEIRTLEL